MPQPTKPTKRQVVHGTGVSANVVAGAAGAGFGAAKLRDLHIHQYGPTHVRSGAKALTQLGVPPRTAVKLVRRNPGFKTAAVAGAAGGVAAASHRYGQYMDHKSRKSVAKKFSGGSSPEDKVTLKERARAARNPPPVERKAVKSTAVASIGYQRPTRRLAVEMTTRRGEPYVYKVKPKVAAKVINADSKGKAYNAEIRRKAPRATKYTVADRARLAADPRSQRKPVAKTSPYADRMWDHIDGKHENANVLSRKNCPACVAEAKKAAKALLPAVGRHRLVRPAL